MKTLNTLNSKHQLRKLCLGAISIASVLAGAYSYADVNPHTRVPLMIIKGCQGASKKYLELANTASAEDLAREANGEQQSAGTSTFDTIKITSMKLEANCAGAAIALLALYADNGLTLDESYAPGLICTSSSLALTSLKEVSRFGLRRIFSVGAEIRTACKDQASGVLASVATEPTESALDKGASKIKGALGSVKSIFPSGPGSTNGPGAESTQSGARGDNSGGDEVFFDPSDYPTE